ncbi:MAG: hypothetical protein ABMA14_28670, partial [Hyphomonadaceae bacterium]
MLPLKLVADNSPEEIARRDAASRIVWPLRRLTSNLMRIARGAGYPYRVPSQLGDLVEAFSAYHQAHGQ